MKFLKKFFIIYILIIVVSCKNHNDNNKNNDIQNLYENNKFGNSLIVDAKIKEYINLEDLEKDSELIVIAKKISQEKPTIFRNDGKHISHVHTKSNFVVLKSFKGLLNINDNFSILESEAYDETTKTNIHVASYEMMKENNEYILFLRKSETVDSYLILAINFGKTPVEEEKDSTLRRNLKSVNNENSIEILKNLKYYDKIRKSVREKYLNKK